MGTHPDILVDSKTLGGRGNNGNFDLLKLRPIMHAHTTHTHTLHTTHNTHTHTHYTHKHTNTHTAHAYISYLH